MIGLELVTKPNVWYFERQPVLVDNFAFRLCTGVRPQNRPIRQNLFRGLTCRTRRRDDFCMVQCL